MLRVGRVVEDGEKCAGDGGREEKTVNGPTSRPGPCFPWDPQHVGQADNLRDPTHAVGALPSPDIRRIPHSPILTNEFAEGDPTSNDFFGIEFEWD